MKTFKKLLFPLIGLSIIYFSFSRLSLNEINKIIFSLLNVNFYLIFISVSLGILSHLLRSFRWNFLLGTLDYKVSFKNLFSSVMIGYLYNFGIPRSGEFTRALYLSKAENLNYSKTFGTIIIERLVDLFSLLFLSIICIIINYDLFLKFSLENFMSFLIIISIICAFVSLIFFSRYFLNKKKVPYLNWFYKIIDEIYIGISSIRNVNSQLSFWFISLIIWLCYFSMFYVIKFNFSEFDSLDINVFFLTFVISTYTLTITNGGIGIYPFIISIILLFFGVPEFLGLTFGWVIWTIQTIIVIFFGVLSLVFMSIESKKIN